MTIRERVVAWQLQHGMGRYERLVAERKRELLSSAQGTILEIGPGAGANLRHYPAEVRWIGVEPNRHLHGPIRTKAASLGLAIDLRRGTAERLDAESESVDVVVSTLVLCSVPSPEAALREILRVLKPGGRFLFIEHVAGPRGSGCRRVQAALAPLWPVLTGGCHPDRPIDLLIESAGFETVSLERFRAPVPVVSPHVAGFARKAGAP
jgi:SAM-dependent methyltransferase